MKTTKIKPIFHKRYKKRAAALLLASDLGPTKLREMHLQARKEGHAEDANYLGHVIGVVDNMHEQRSFFTPFFKEHVLRNLSNEFPCLI